MRDLMAMSVRQPWAWAIARGLKNVHGRPEPTTHRGIVVIHAASNWDRSGEASPLFTSHINSRNTKRFPRRALIAVAELSGCHSRDGCTPWAGPGDWHWLLTNIWRLPRPVPAQGQPGLWRLPPDLAHAVITQLLPEAQHA